MDQWIPVTDDQGRQIGLRAWRPLSGGWLTVLQRLDGDIVAAVFEPSLEAWHRYPVSVALDVGRVTHEPQPLPPPPKETPA